MVNWNARHFLTVGSPPAASTRRSGCDSTASSSASSTYSTSTLSSPTLMAFPSAAQQSTSLRPAPFTPVAASSYLLDCSHSSSAATSTTPSPTLVPAPSCCRASASASASAPSKHIGYPDDSESDKSSSPSSPAVAPRKLPHNNFKYEPVYLDFIMYNRCDKELPWKEVTARYNRVRASLQRFARHSKPAPPRSDSGLQAVYYRRRLQLPELDRAGNLVFDPLTGRQVVRECKVRKERDVKADLIAMFPERVVYCNYEFVGEKDMARAKLLAAKYDRQRMEHGQPPWSPDNEPTTTRQSKKGGL